MRTFRRTFGLFLALLALSYQLALGATVPAAALQAVQPLAGFGIICHADDGTGSSAPSHHQAPDCQLCPLCVAFATPTATLATGPSVPLPASVALLVAASHPSSTVPPAARILAARPRGPPALA